MRLSEDFLRTLHDNNDIISVAQSYVTLKRSGNSYMCCCPFHAEKTPSCSFSPDKQLFHCFGCGAGGDVITFIRQIENLDYMDAVRFLAQRAGMPMPEDNGDNDASRKRQRLYEIQREAGRFFHKKLFSEEGAAGLDYLRRRGLSDHTIKRFGLGFAKDDYHDLHMYLRNLGYSDYEMVDASLLVNNNNRFYDKFRNRVMFPIFDTRGNVAAFGGRALTDEQKPKYLNSSETTVFSKSDLLFALNIAKNSKADYFILCEGYMDVISMHQAGFDSAVASLGTALTEHQCSMLARLGKKEIILSYDSDEAGQKAASRAIGLLSAVGVRSRVLKMDGAKDPDEFIKKFGAEAFKSLIENSSGAIQFQMDKLSAGLDLQTDDGRAAYVKNAVPFIAQIGNEIDRAVSISRVAKTAGIPAETVRSAVENQILINKRSRKKKEQAELTRPVRDNINPDKAKFPKEEGAERGIICFLYHNPDKLNNILERLEREFVTDFNKRVFDFLANAVKNGLSPDISLFNEEFTPAEMGRISEIIGNTLFANNKEVLADYIEVINNHSITKNGEPEVLSDKELLETMQKLKERKS